MIEGGSELLSPGGTLQVFASLLLVLASIVALGWVSRRVPRLGRQRGRSLRVLDALPLGSRERVVLLEVEGTQLLVGLAPGRVQTLHVFGDAAPSGQTPQAAPGRRADTAAAPSATPAGAPSVDASPRAAATADTATLNAATQHATVAGTTPAPPPRRADRGAAGDFAALLKKS